MHKNKAKQESASQKNNHPKDDIVSNLLERGVTDVIVKKDLEAMLRSGKKIKVYLGIDPTSTQIHLGNAIPLRKLRDFQNTGHHVIFLVGSFTALIGDTSDKKAMRQPLTQEQIEENFKTYKQQASKILDFSKCEIKYNGDWLGKLTFKEIVELASKFTVQQMIEREMYQMRLKENKPIGLHEFLYPLMQGYDSVAMDVDLEIGGNDQLFNMLAGRTLQKIMKNKEKYVLCTPLIEGTDGRKMSKSYGNTINISDTPKEKYGKLMSMQDELIVKYFEMCTDVPGQEIEEIKKSLADGSNPRDAKMRLAREIIKLYDSEKEAQEAEQEFINVFQKHEIPDDMEEMQLGSESMNIIELLMITKLASSKSDARRLIDGGGVRVDNEKVGGWEEIIDLKKEKILQVGRRKFVKVRK